MPIQLSHDHVAIRAVDYAGAIAWYRDKLDFTLDQEWPFGDMQLAYLSNGTAKIEILGGSASSTSRLRCQPRCPARHSANARTSRITPNTRK